MQRRKSILMILVSLTFFVITANAQTRKDTRTVLDLYNLIGKTHLSYKAETEKIKVKDINNGYLKIDVADGAKQVEVALFRKPDGSPLLVVSFENNDFENDFRPNAVFAFEVSEFDKNEMDDVTEDVFPTLSNRESLALFNKNRKMKSKTAEYIAIVHKLPRNGKIISVTASNTGEEGEFEADVKIYELHLQNDKFVIKNK